MFKFSNYAVIRGVFHATVWQVLLFSNIMYYYSLQKLSKLSKLYLQQFINIIFIITVINKWFYQGPFWWNILKICLNIYVHFLKTGSALRQSETAESGLNSRQLCCCWNAHLACANAHIILMVHNKLIFYWSQT